MCSLVRAAAFARPPRLLYLFTTGVDQPLREHTQNQSKTRVEIPSAASSAPPPTSALRLQSSAVPRQRSPLSFILNPRGAQTSVIAVPAGRMWKGAGSDF